MVIYKMDKIWGIGFSAVLCCGELMIFWETLSRSGGCRKESLAAFRVVEYF